MSMKTAIRTMSMVIIIMGMGTATTTIITMPPTNMLAGNFSPAKPCSK